MTSLLERSRAIVGAEPTRTVRGLPYAVLLVDLAMIAVAGLLAIAGRERLTMLEPGAIQSTLGVAGPLTALGWLIAIVLAGGYQRGVFGNGTDEFKRVWGASLTAAGLTGVGCYLTKFDLSRGFFFLLFVIGVPALILGRWGVRQLLHSARRHGYLQVRVLVSGTPDHVDEVTGVLRRESWLGYSVVGAVTPTEALVDETAIGVPVLGRSEDLLSVASECRADIIFFAAGSLASGEKMKETLWELRSTTSTWS